MRGCFVRGCFLRFAFFVIVVASRGQGLWHIHILYACSCSAHSLLLFLNVTTWSSFRFYVPQLLRFFLWFCGLFALGAAAAEEQSSDETGKAATACTCANFIGFSGGWHSSSFISISGDLINSGLWLGRAWLHCIRGSPRCFPASTTTPPLSRDAHHH